MKIHYISPYRKDKNIGRAINEAVSVLTADSDDWIVHTDHDMLFLLPDSKQHIEDILSGTDFDILGCMTNRVGVHEQLVSGIFSDNSDISAHIALAKQCIEVIGGQINATGGPIGAFMMCFRVSVWQFLGGFKEGFINFDALFCQSARSQGFKTGIMRGIYVFHLYRWGSSNPRRDIRHLMQ